MADHIITAALLWAIMLWPVYYHGRTVCLMAKKQCVWRALTWPAYCVWGAAAMINEATQLRGLYWWFRWRQYPSFNWHPLRYWHPVMFEASRHKYRSTHATPQF